MKLSNLHTKIISKEPYNDMKIFTESYDNSEEIPLVSRHHRLKQFRKKLGRKGVRDLLINLSIFVLNTALMVSKIKKRERPFFAITFTDFDGYAKNGFTIPDIFIYPEGHALGFPDKLRRRAAGPSSEMQAIKGMFKRVGAEGEFEFIESRFHDPACYDEIIRIYAIPKIITPGKNV